MNAVRVVKVGGSLFDYDHLVPAFRRWLALQPPLATVLIAGGGPWADAIRLADMRFGLADEASHWLCIGAMGVTARLLAALLPEAEFESAGVGSLVRRMGSMDGKDPTGESDSGALIIFDPGEFLHHEEPLLANPLPHTWSVTSDSIAARVAEVLTAQELVLLKSSFATKSATYVEAAESGFLDSHFTCVVSKQAFCRAVNLRDEKFREIRLSK